MQHALQSAHLDIKVDSAGTHALVGEAPDELAQQVMDAAGINIASQTASQCRTSNVMQADVVLVMEDMHRQWLHQHIPESRGRVFMLGKWHEDEPVPDPYQRPIDQFEYVRTMIEQYCGEWLNWLSTVT